jgi:hypothetical protein
MRTFVSSKPALLFFGLAVALCAGLGADYRSPAWTPPAHAAASAGLKGWAWSETIGWICFYDATSCPNAFVGVNNDGTLTGYAWSENIGWIQFGGLSGFPTSGSTQIIALTSGSSLTIPSDWNSSSNAIYAIGGGGGAAATGVLTGYSGGGGGGGAFSKIVNVSLAPNTTIAYQVGQGGAPGSSGGDSYLCSSASNCSSLSDSGVIVGAQGGKTAGLSGGYPIIGGAGGNFLMGVGCSAGGCKYSGGDGFSGGSPVIAGPGGGAAGPSGKGGDGAIINGGDGDAHKGGKGGVAVSASSPGSPGTELFSLYGAGGGGSGAPSAGIGAAGGLYGGGGGSARGSAYAGGAGAQGIILITYNSSAPAGQNAQIQDNKLVGWAKAVSGDASTDWDGWISLNGTNYGPVISGTSMSGYAWGGDVVGWVDFSGVTYTPPLPTCTLVNPGNPVPPSANFSLTWTTQNGASASIDRGVGVVTPIGSGSTSATAPSTQGSYTYTMTVTNSTGDTNTCSTVVSVDAPLTINDFSINPARVRPGNASILSWNISNFSDGACVITGTDGSSYPLATASGSQQTNPIAQITNFTLSCTGATSVTKTANLVPSFQEI